MTSPLRRYDFSERLADILGESRRDLRVRVTLLVSAGIFPPGRRGPGAPVATPDDAAALLLGVLAAPAQVHTAEAVRMYGDLVPTALAPGAPATGIYLGPPSEGLPAERPRAHLPLLVGRPPLREAMARLFEDVALGDANDRAALSRDIFGLWVARGFPVAALQFAGWREGQRTLWSQRFELRDGARPPAWLDPTRGGTADPGLLLSAFLPIHKLLAIGTLISPQPERTRSMHGMSPVHSRPLHASALHDRIAGLADLVRTRRNRRPWERFLGKAEEAFARVQEIESRPSRLSEVTAFGSNPGNLKMYRYVPPGLPAGAPLVVVLHGCTQTAASYDDGTGWTTLADRHGFAVLLPEQRRRNNPLRCFNWFKAEDTARDSGEVLSIRQMVDRMVADHGLDASQVYVTGVSAGGAMASSLLATYPDVFAGGAIIAGVPYRAALGLQEGFDVIFQGRTLPPVEWGDRVRQASGHSGPWPRVTVWHGAEDGTVSPVNAEEIVKQWADVHGLEHHHSAEDRVQGHRRRQWHGPDGAVVLESYTVNGMAHGVPIDPAGAEGVGNPAPFILDVGICSTRHIAASWGLTARQHEVPAVIALPATTEGHADTTPPARAREDREDREDDAVFHADVGHDEGAAQDFDLGVDIEGILTKSFEAAGLLQGGRGKPGVVAGIDIPGLVTASLQAAGVMRGGGPGIGKGQARGPAGIDIPGILAASFQAAGLLRPDPGTARDGTAAEWTPEPAPEPAVEPAPEPTAEAPSEASAEAAGEDVSEGWRLFQSADAAPAGADESPDGAVLSGEVSSGDDGEVGSRVRSVSCRLALGPQPTLAYARRLDLKASANIFTTARFRVLVDGQPVDEVNAVGMDYVETAWTDRRGVDLTPFAGSTVTLTFEVAANANVCQAVSAKAWIRSIVVGDATDAAGTAA